jgi:RNA polymerase sigma-70 factor, ECF subfamily
VTRPGARRAQPEAPRGNFSCLPRHYSSWAHVTDEQLITDARAGSREAFEALFERYRQPVWEFFRRRTADAARAEELAQDTFVALLEGAARYEARAAFRTYLFGIAYNILHADRRKAAIRRSDPLVFDPASDNATDPDAGLWVRRALATLEDDDREILMLRDYEELSYQEIADVRHLPLNTVRSKLFRARMAMKAALAPRETQLRTAR